MKNKISIVIPSYKESATVSLLVKKILKVLPKAKIIAVDDSSLKENKEIKKKLKEVSKTIIVISRFKKLGRGTAVIQGFKEVLKDATADYVFEIDSDLAHDPIEMPRFLNKIKVGEYDVVIGSRYIKDGKTINIVLNRIILSKIINLFLRIWLSIKLTDFTGGFRIYNRKSIEFLSKTKMKSKGFIMLSETIYQLHKNGYKIGEVPITVSVKKEGKSNADIKEFYISLLFILKMRLGDIFSNIFKEVKIGAYRNWIKIIFITLIFFFCLSLRLTTLNQIGRTWDEFEFIEQGYKMIELVKKGDVGNSFFHTTYDHPPLVKYLYGVTAHFDTERILGNGGPVFKYEYTFSRILSAVMFSLGVVITVLIGWKIFSPVVGVISGLILSMLPFSLGLSQLVTAESLKILTYPLTIYFYINLIKERVTKRSVLFAGVATGIALQAKQSNFLLIVLLGIIFFLLYKKFKNINKKNFLQTRIKVFFVISITAVLAFLVLWPQSIFHIKDILEINQKLWGMQFSPKIWQITLAPPEVFFGRLMLVPVFYYVVYFFISIPALILILFFAGFRNLIKSKNIYFLTILLWFLLPFTLSFYSWRQHGLRYIIEIYPAIALISAFGFDQLASKFTSDNIKKFLFFIPVFIYLLIVLWQIKPYYLDYFNELVDGVNNVYEKKLFQIGWWGQGIGEAGYFIKNNAPRDSEIGLALSPPHVFPFLKDFKISKYEANKEYNYVVVNYYNVIREGFDDSLVRRNYSPIHRVLSDKAVLVTVYKK